MKTELINLRKSKTIPTDAIYIGRGTPWGNPFIINIHGTREEVISKYRAYLLRHPELLSQLEELRGKTLACWCKPLPCHGDVLIEFLEKGIPSE